MGNAQFLENLCRPRRRHHTAYTRPRVSGTFVHSTNGFLIVKWPEEDKTLPILTVAVGKFVVQEQTNIVQRDNREYIMIILSSVRISDTA